VKCVNVQMKYLPSYPVIQVNKRIIGNLINGLINTDININILILCIKIKIISHYR